MNTQPILIIEDSPEDYEATRRALKKSGLTNPIFHCVDGNDALDFLYQRGVYSGLKTAPRPGFILIDLNLPGVNGLEVLTEIKRDGNLRNIPAIILTTSSDERDIGVCYRAGANSYIQKPVNFDGFVHAIQGLKDYWFDIVIMPEENM